MMTPLPSDPAPRLADNILAFVRTLRSAGLRAGPAHVLDALQCVTTVGPGQRDDVYWALHAALVRSPGERKIFDQAFHLFFRNPRLLEQMMALIMPTSPVATTVSRDDQALTRRLAEALVHPQHTHEDAPQEKIVDAVLTTSDREVLGKKDFEEMSTAELDAARAAIAELLPQLPRRPSRRWRPSPYGHRLDVRATMRHAQRHGGELVQLVRSSPALRDVPVVLLCDVSGSMARYSRIFLHFAHTLATRRAQVHTFVFATRLSNVTRALAVRDADQAVARAGAQVQDWEGGTRIAEALRSFNYDWARRVLSDRAMVVMLSDGLERDVSPLLEREAARLGRTASRWLWLNPLLRFEGFEPRAAGIRGLLPHVSAMLPAHNLHSLRQLANLLVS